MMSENLWNPAAWRASLVPFFTCVGIYFMLCAWRARGDGGGSGGKEEEVAWQVILVTVATKCAPILCLLSFVGTHRADPDISPQARRYCSLLSVALGLSAVGDAALVLPEGEASGILSFGAAQLAYIAAFRFHPRCWYLGLPLYLVAALYARLLQVPSSLQYLVPLYTALLATMAWRGSARAAPPDAPRGALCAAGGALSFTISDAILSYSMFNGDVPYRLVLVMVSYYLGQLGIAVSAAELVCDKQHAH